MIKKAKNISVDMYICMHHDVAASYYCNHNVWQIVRDTPTPNTYIVENIHGWDYIMVDKLITLLFLYLM
jgi:hypothetical protein